MLKSYKQFMLQEEETSVVPVSSDDFSSYSAVISKIIEDRSADFRRLVQRSLSSGLFDGNPDLLSKAKELHTKLSAGTFSQNKQDIVSKPAVDGTAEAE